MPDRHGGDAVEGADAALVRFAPGVSAEALRRALVPGYLVVMVAFVLVHTPLVSTALRLPYSQLVSVAVSALIVWCGLLARRASGTTIERRFWTVVTVAATSMALSQITYVLEVLSRSGAEPPLASVSTAFDVLTVIMLLGLLLSMARFRQSTWMARARFIIDTIAACVVFVGILDDWVVGPAFATQANRGLSGALYSAYPVIGMLMLLGTLGVLIGTRFDRWQSWERRIAAAAAAFALALLLTPVAYLGAVVRFTAGWSTSVIDGVLLTGLCLALAAVVHRLARHRTPWRLRPIATLEPSYGWLAAVALPSTELLALPLFGLMAFQTGDPAERAFRLGIVAVVSVALAARTLLAVADSEALLTRADTDPLTGLLNHRLFHDRLSDEVTRALRHGESVGLVTLDVDDFGAVNSAGGHLAGDRALVEIAVAVCAAVRSQDVVCRIGGDEITVILPGADVGSTYVTARRILDGVRAVPGSTGRPLTASAGIAACPEHASDRDTLVAAADAAMYWAKRHGKDRAVIYDPQVVAPVDPQQRIRDLREQTNLEAVRALAAAVDARDPGTHDHSRNVSALATELARYIGIDEDTVTLIGFAALLHDVGKIGVPDSILHKRGVLSADDRARLLEHASLGAHILAATPMAAVPQWVRHHHERWDGAGGPDGLAGEQIPLGARIIALCEAYDSLVSGRSNRQPLTHRAALQQIDLDLDGKFDPVLGERFIRMMAERAGMAFEGKGAS
jgi:diguanylate cyclase (GGDEF)-like protein/putative nucleotidyltransferase with HDIG domain